MATGAAYAFKGRRRAERVKGVHSPSPCSLMALGALGALATRALGALAMFCAPVKSALCTLGASTALIMDVWNKEVSQNNTIWQIAITESEDNHQAAINTTSDINTMQWIAHMHQKEFEVR